jgi:DNA polymerase-1
MPRLYLIDGYALIYRAFYALISRPLRTSRGENTSAAWGVANFLLRLRTKYHPEYVIWVNDAGDSGRTELYPEYKSTREKLDEPQQDFDLAPPIESPRLRVVKVAVPGWEADDVIGTLATKARDKVSRRSSCRATRILSAHRAWNLLAQSGRGGPAGVEETWSTPNARAPGCPPPRSWTTRAAGRQSDNVPGVKGIGDKGAPAAGIRRP